LNKNNLLSAALNTSGEQSVDPAPKFLTITPKTLQLGHGSEIFQIKNLTRVGKYKVIESKFPIILIIIVAMAGLGALVSMSKVGFIFGLLLLAIAAYGVWSRTQPGTFAFGFECNSGATRYLHTKDEQFIDKIVNIVSSYIEAEQTASVQINIEDRSVTNTGIINGATIDTGNSK
jgi:hypothetical protein